MPHDTYALPDVLAFYASLPFNYRGDVTRQAGRDVEHNPLDYHPPLASVCSQGARVLDLGCGAGWFSNALRRHNDVEVTGVDFNEVAVERARQVAKHLDLPVRFLVQDLFRLKPGKPYDLVVSLGVLHHTGDCRAALRHVCRHLVRDGGHIYVGLYHAYGRRPFLDHFETMKRRGDSEEAMFKEYRRLHSVLEGDETMQRSWFRDQVLHPHETQHTQREMNRLLAEEGMTLVASSINRFEPFTDPAELERLEPALEERGREQLKRGVYFPGFFTFLARKPKARS